MRKKKKTAIPSPPEVTVNLGAGGGNLAASERPDAGGDIRLCHIFVVASYGGGKEKKERWIGRAGAERGDRSGVWGQLILENKEAQASSYRAPQPFVLQIAFTRPRRPLQRLASHSANGLGRPRQVFWDSPRKQKLFLVAVKRCSVRLPPGRRGEKNKKKTKPKKPKQKKKLHNGLLC